MKLRKLTDEQVQEMNSIGATDFRTIYQAGDISGSENEYATLSEDEDGTWIFFFMDRVECFEQKTDAVRFAERKGCYIKDDAHKTPTCKEPRGMNPYERTRATVYATGNRWAIENFEATH